MIHPLVMCGEYVWAGGFFDQRIAQLDGRTGAVLMVTDVPSTPYGMAFDAQQNLWISTTLEQNLIRVDTRRCNADVGCPAGVCNGDTAGCDLSVKQMIPTVDAMYGITVAEDQTVWMGGYQVMHYDPFAPSGSRFETLNHRSGTIHAGIALDTRGHVWTAGNWGVLRIDSTDINNYLEIPSDEASLRARGWGVAVDAEDKVWVINRWEDQAHVITPGADLSAWTAEIATTSLQTPYTYSDMTGTQLRLASTLRGTYVQDFEGCAGGDTQWQELRFDVDTPADMFVAFRIRTASDPADFPSVPWATVGVVPTGTSPLDVSSVLATAGLAQARYAQVEVALVSNGCAHVVRSNTSGTWLCTRAPLHSR